MNWLIPLLIRLYRWVSKFKTKINVDDIEFTIDTTIAGAWLTTNGAPITFEIEDAWREALFTPGDDVDEHEDLFDWRDLSLIIGGNGENRNYRFAHHYPINQCHGGIKFFNSKTKIKK